MKPQHFNIRIDRTTGDFWLVIEKPAQPIKRIRNITSEVLLALCADLFETQGTKEVQRDIKFSDGGLVRLTVADLGIETPITEPVRLVVEMPDRVMATT